MKKEAKARIRINRLLEHSGWRDVIPEYIKGYVSLNTFL